MTIVMTGATGFLGSRLLRAMLATGTAPVTVLGRDGAGQPLAARLESALRACGATASELLRARDRLTAVPVDLTLPRLGLEEAAHRRLAEGADAVWHCAAAISLVGTADTLAPVNVTGTRHLTELAEHTPAHAPFVHTSTAYVAGGAPVGTGLSFGDAITGYEQTKQQAEEIVRDWADRHRRPALVLRPSLLATEHPVPETAAQQPLSMLGAGLRTLVEQAPPLLRRALLRKRAGVPRVRLRLQGDPASHLNIVPVDYAVDAMLRLARLPHPPGSTAYHVVHPEETSARVLITAVGEILPGVELALRPAVERPNLIESRINPVLANFLQRDWHSRADAGAPLRDTLPDLPAPAAVDSAYIRAAMNVRLPAPR
ncbi:SDR family oxidoreductase [Streptomyces sp. NPDC020379]|uniref:SDR family oxidoreductase n=1 Tax=Streptomyces sp. NPDC020379 TaxID=3365071 RepID=UPI0037B61228